MAQMKKVNATLNKFSLIKLGFNLAVSALHEATGLGYNHWVLKVANPLVAPDLMVAI